jgi:hypothetical protein
MWDYFVGQHLFHGRDSEGEYRGTNMIAEMVGSLVLPPEEFVRRSDVTKNVFDDEGISTMAPTKQG